MDKSISVIGYSGHAYVVIDGLYSNGYSVTGYFEAEPKKVNPYNLGYLGIENEKTIRDTDWIVAVGDNLIRKKIIDRYPSAHVGLKTVIHQSALVGSHVEIEKGVFVSANAVINACAKIGLGAIVNTGAIIEHECIIGNYSHICPGTVLAGNVTVGACTFIGANAVVKQGVTIGDNVTVGAGTVVLCDIADGDTIVGNPGRTINRK